MTVLINYKKNILKKSIVNTILFVDEKFNISNLKKNILPSEHTFISDLIKTKDIKEKIITFDISSKRKIILISIKNDFENSDLENLGAKFYDLFKNANRTEFNLDTETKTGKQKRLIQSKPVSLALVKFHFWVTTNSFAEP